MPRVLRDKKFVAIVAAVLLTVAGVAAYTVWPSEQNNTSPSQSVIAAPVPPLVAADNCVDGQKGALGILAVTTKYVPCPNSYLRTRVEHGIAVGVHSNSRAHLSTRPLESSPELYSDRWVVTMSEPLQDTHVTDSGKRIVDRTYARLGYGYPYGLTHFVYFVREDGFGWAAVLNVDDYAFLTDKSYDVIFTWYDPKYPTTTTMALVPENCELIGTTGELHNC